MIANRKKCVARIAEKRIARREASEIAARGIYIQVSIRSRVTYYTRRKSESERVIAVTAQAIASLYIHTHTHTHTRARARIYTLSSCFYCTVV